MPRSDWKICHEKLGNGSFGIVYKVCESKSGLNCETDECGFVVKVQKSNTIEANNDLLYLRMIQGSKYAVNMYDYWESGDKLYIVMDRLKYSYDEEVKYVAKNQKISISNARVLVQGEYCAAVMGLAQEKGIVSTDTHIGNIMFTENHKPKLFDFGVGTVLEEKVGSVQFDKMKAIASTGACVVSPPKIFYDIVDEDNNSYSVSFNPINEMLRIKSGTYKLNIQKKSKDKIFYLEDETPVVQSLFDMKPLVYEEVMEDAPPTEEQERVLKYMHCLAIRFMLSTMGPMINSEEIMVRNLADWDPIKFYTTLGYTILPVQKENEAKYAKKTELIMTLKLNNAKC